MDLNLAVWVFLGFVLFLGLCVLLLFNSWNRRPLPERENVDTFKTNYPKLKKAQLQERTKGQFIELGLDRSSHQNAILKGSDRFAHVLNIGRSGIGKTQYFINTFLWRDIGYKENALFIFDGQGDLTEPVLGLCQAYGREHVIYPDAGFNPLGGTGLVHERVERFNDVFAQMLELISGPGDYYTQRAQVWARYVVPVFEQVYGRAITLNELQILAADRDIRTKLLHKAGNSSESASYARYCDWDKGEHDRNVSGLLNFLDRIQVGDRRWQYNRRNAPSLEDQLDAKKVIVIREGGDKRSTDRTIGLLFMVSFQNYVRKRGVGEIREVGAKETYTPHPVYAYIDEAHMYFNPNFPTLMQTARKKNVALHLGFQNFNQFHPYTDEIMGNAGSWIVHGGLTDADATIVAENIGVRQHVDHTFSITPGKVQDRTTHSQSISYGYQEGFYPHQIRHLAADLVINISIEDREVQPTRILIKPPKDTTALVAFTSKQVPEHAPPTVWDEELATNADHTSQPNQQISPDFSDFPEVDSSQREGSNIVDFSDKRKQRGNRRGSRRNNQQPPSHPTPPEAPDW